MQHAYTGIQCARAVVQLCTAYSVEHFIIIYDTRQQRRRRRATTSGMLAHKCIVGVFWFRLWNAVAACRMEIYIVISIDDCVFLCFKFILGSSSIPACALIVNFELWIWFDCTLIFFPFTFIPMTIFFSSQFAARFSLRSVFSAIAVKESDIVEIPHNCLETIAFERRRYDVRRIFLSTL